MEGSIEICSLTRRYPVSILGAKCSLYCEMCLCSKMLQVGKRHALVLTSHTTQWL